MLRAAGLRTLEASTGGEAIALARCRLPDVILMDLGLPDMHGTAAARHLAAAKRTASVPVVALTSLPLPGNAWLADAGFAGYVEKPFDVAAFPDLVRSYCVRPAG